MKEDSIYIAAALELEARQPCAGTPAGNAPYTQEQYATMRELGEDLLTAHIDRVFVPTFDPNGQMVLRTMECPVVHYGAGLVTIGPRGDRVPFVPGRISG